jgi:uncharacterized protein (TIRG00374 family)
VLTSKFTVTGRTEIIVTKQSKNIINIAILVLLMVVTFYLLFKDENLNEIFQIVKQVSLGFVVLAAIFATFRITGEAYSIYIILKSLGEKTSFLKCLKYAFVGFYFSAITPSASGGQPVQLLYMKKDALNLANSTLTLILITILYKSVLLLIGLWGIFYLGFSDKLDFGVINYLFILGFILHVILVVFYIALLFSKKWIKIIIQKCIYVLWKIHVLKNPKKWWDKWTLLMEHYHVGSSYIKNNGWMIGKIFLVMLLQRLAMFMGTYCIYRGFGFTLATPLEIIFLQSVVAISSDLMPLPGGVGINEKCYISVFQQVISKEMLLPSMLLSRGISFYGMVLISGIAISLSHLRKIKKL